VWLYFPERQKCHTHLIHAQASARRIEALSRKPPSRIKWFLLDARETVETVLGILKELPITWLKPGENETQNPLCDESRALNHSLANSRSA
jgi:hypothetical protein